MLKWLCNFQRLCFTFLFCLVSLVSLRLPLISARATYSLWIGKRIIHLAGTKSTPWAETCYVEISLTVSFPCLIGRGESLANRDEDQFPRLLDLSKAPPQPLIPESPDPPGVVTRIFFFGGVAAKMPCYCASLFSSRLPSSFLSFLVLISLFFFFISCVYLSPERAVYGSSSKLEVQFMLFNHQFSVTQVQTLGREDPLEDGMATHSSILAWRIPWTEESRGL